MQQGICNPEFYDDLVYKYKKIIGNSKSRAKVCTQWGILKPLGSLLATDRSKAVVFV